MTRCRTYSPVHHVPADLLARTSAPGHRTVVPSGQGGLGETPSYRALAPNGADGSPTIVHCSFYIVHCWTYTFSAKEKDSETGLSYFGSRYYSSDLSIWLSVDPMVAKYASLSPYVYCANNPVKLVDPNGEEVWIPDPDGNLIAQENDNYETLAILLHCSNRKAKKILKSQGYENGVNKDDVVKLDNRYTRSINASCDQSLTDEEAISYSQQLERKGYGEEAIEEELRTKACPQDLYNCWSAAIAGIRNRVIGPSNYTIFNEEAFDKVLENMVSVGTDRLIFGKTVIRFAIDGKCTHAAVYYGTDKDGNIYIYSKNGRFTRPVVMPLNEFMNRYGATYGEVTGYYN